MGVREPALMSCKVEVHSDVDWSDAICDHCDELEERIRNITREWCEEMTERYGNTFHFTAD